MFASAKRIVIKVGSSLLIGEDGFERGDWITTLISDIASLKHQGKDVIVVTSGAVALGRHVLGYGLRPLELEEKQAAAACGQISLMALWTEKLRAPGVNLYPAQILLTAHDLNDRRRYLNARNTFETLLGKGNVIPIINENDTVATAELRFGDNDKLAAQVAQMAAADMLILLSDVDGLYNADPRHDKSAQHKAVIEEITPEIEAMAGGTIGVGTGGMISKVAAAKIATSAGCSMIIMNGHANHPIERLEKNGERHTIFKAKETPLSARKHWIAGSIHPAGSISVDDGAAMALKSGKSLLPAGVTAVEGPFDRGDAVLIRNKLGTILGKGLIAYASEDALRIIGKKSQEIEQILGFKRRDVLIHRDDMVLE